MKILTIAATPFFSDRGCHIRIYNEAKYLEKLGARTRLCTYHIGEDIPRLGIVRIKGPKGYKKASPGFSWGKIWLDFKLLFLVRREIRSFQPDAIHAHLYEGLAIGYLAKKLAWRKNIPVVFDLQGNIDEEFASYSQKNSVAQKFFVWLSRKIIDWADKIVVSSENVICRCPTPTTVIKDGVDKDLFKNPQNLSKEELEKIKKIKKWAGDSKLLVYVGGLSDNKGIGDLLKSFSKVRPFSPRRHVGVPQGQTLKKSWKLLIGGFGKDEGKYKKFIKENDLNGDVYFAGKVNYFSLPHYLALANAGIDPKKNSTESSGKLMNYMAAGLPVICFDNQLNRARLGEKGFYLKSFNDLPEILTDIKNAEKIDYDLESLSEEKEARKLFEILKSLTK